MFNCIMLFFSAASSLTNANIDPSDYTISKQLHSKLMLYAKIDRVSDNLVAAYWYIDDELCIHQMFIIPE